MRPSNQLLSLFFAVLATTPLFALDIEFSWDCDDDRVEEKNGTVRGDEGEITFKNLTAEKIEYEFRTGSATANLSSDTSKVKSLCFGSSSRTFDAAMEAWNGGDYVTAGQGFEQAAGERGAAAVWAGQLGYYYAGLSYMNSGNFQAANRAFDALQRQHPKHMFGSEVQKYQVQIKNNLGDANGALQLLDQLLRPVDLSDAARYDFNVLKAQILVQQKRWLDAKKAYQEAQSAADNPAQEMRCSLGVADVDLQEGNIASARSAAGRVLRQTSFDEPAQHEARAYAYVLEGDCFLADAKAQASNPNAVRNLWQQALDRYLRVVAIHGADESIASEIRGRAFQSIDDVAGRLNLRDVQGSARAKAAASGF